MRNGLDLLRDVNVTLTVELGQCQLKLKDALALGADSVVQLDKLTDELLDVFVNGKAIAKGEIIAQGDRFGLRVVHLLNEEYESTPQPRSYRMPATSEPSAGHMDDYGAAGNGAQSAPQSAAPEEAPATPKPSAAELAAMAAAELGIEMGGDTAGEGNS